MFDEMDKDNAGDSYSSEDVSHVNSRIRQCGRSVSVFHKWFGVSANLINVYDSQGVLVLFSCHLFSKTDHSPDLDMVISKI